MFCPRHFPSKCNRLDLLFFLCCIIRGLHGALMKVPQPVAISLHEDGFAV